MSSSSTHMLIGAAGGASLFRLHELLAASTIGRTRCGDIGSRCVPVTVEGGVAGWLLPVLLVLASAILATWSDSDEPGSFIGRRFRVAVSLAGGALVALTGWSASTAGAFDQWWHAIVLLAHGLWFLSERML